MKQKIEDILFDIKGYTIISLCFIVEAIYGFENFKRLSEKILDWVEKREKMV